ncbi:LysM peptidoglycan-binding domain-containing protein [Blastococcus sp. SYSU D01042]
MGSVAQAVVEFDEAVQAPWRPPLAGGTARRGQLRAVPDPVRQPSPPRPPVERAAVAPAAVRRTPSTPAARPARPARPAPRMAPPGHGPVVPAAPGLRLTRRARRLGVVLGLAVGVVLGSWVGSAVAGGEEGLRLAGEVSVVVEQGDTLWSIAAAVAGDEEDVRAVVAEIRERNELRDAALVPGQVLVLP